MDSLRLRFGIGLRDGALMEGDNWCAFRIYVNGARLWSITKQTNKWERFLLDLPSLAGQDMILQFMTDGLGDARWNWAVWAEPLLLGYGPPARDQRLISRPVHYTPSGRCAHGVDISPVDIPPQTTPSDIEYHRRGVRTPTCEPLVGLPCLCY